MKAQAFDDVRPESFFNCLHASSAHSLWVATAIIIPAATASFDRQIESVPTASDRTGISRYSSLMTHHKPCAVANTVVPHQPPAVRPNNAIELIMHVF